MSRIILSHEQRAVIDKIKEGKNVIVDAVAGSGKTTTVLGIAEQCSGTLQLTYNSQLKSEVRKKAASMGIEDIEIHTYHSLAVNYYDPNAHTDFALFRVVEQNIRPKTLPTVTVLVIDEAQDMTPLYFRFSLKFMEDLRDSQSMIPTLAILGDRYQSIYRFKGSDSRFLTRADKLFNMKFERLTLSTSYRLTNQIADFVNIRMLGNKRISAVRNGADVKIIDSGTSFQAHAKIAPSFVKLIKSGDIDPGEIFVLASSIKNPASPIRLLERYFTFWGIPIYMPVSEDSQINDYAAQGKVTFSTFCQSKGRERKYVIVYGFDSGHFEYFSRDVSQDICPPELYVAATRAKEVLILVKCVNKSELPFLYNPDGSPRDFRMTPNTQKLSESVTKVIGFLSEAVSMKIAAKLNKLFTVIKPPSRDIKIKKLTGCGLTEYKKLCESVAELNGTAIPGLWEIRRTGSCKIIETLKKFTHSKPEEYGLTPHVRILMRTSGLTIPEFLQICNVYHSTKERTIHRINQITKFDWLPESSVTECHEVLDAEINIENAAERISIKHSMPIYGVMDMITPDRVIEIKCTDSIKSEHQLQLLMYSWITEFADKKYHLINIRTGEVQEMLYDSIMINEIAELIFDCKFGKNTVLSDDEFTKLVLGS